MIKKVFARILLFFFSAILLFPSLNSSLVLIDFEINRDYIASFLCVDRNVAESSCNGQCHLSKELKKIDESNHEKKNVNIETEIVLIHTVFSATKIKNIIEFTLKNEFNVFQSGNTHLGYMSVKGHPPQFG